MIVGVVAQQGAGVPRSLLLAPDDVYYDGWEFLDYYTFTQMVETAGQTIVTRDLDQIAWPGLVAAPDAVPAPAARQDSGLIPGLVLDIDVALGASTRLPQQNLQPALYVVPDVIGLPQVTFPGGVLAAGLFADDGVIFAPFVVAPGSLGASPFADAETFYAPAATLPLMLRPGRPVDVESFSAPFVLGGITLPSLVVDADTVGVVVTKLFASAPPVVVAADQIFISTVGVPALLDGAISGLAVSNGNLTATVITAGAVASAVSASFMTSGKLYFEITAGLIHDIYTGFGIGQANTDYTSMSPAVYVNAARGDVSVSGNLSGYNLGAGASGNVYGFAVDLNARLIWVRRYGELWNGDAAADPVTGVNGVAIPAGAWAPFVRFATNSVVGDNATANFSQSAYFASAPAGYGFWSRVIIKSFPPAVIDNDVFPAPVVAQVFTPAVADGDVVYAPALAGGIVRATLDGETYSTALSNGDLTAIHANTQNDSGARSTALKTGGKYYFEMTMTTTHGDYDSVGLITSDANYANLVSYGEKCVAVEKIDGTILANDTDSGKTLGSCTSGDVISFAVDMTARLAWLRKNGGNWNGLALSLENPNTGAGGVMIAPSVSFAPAVGFGGNGTAVGDRMDANFGQSTFAYARPIGFGDWTATVVPLGMLITFNGVPANTTLSSGNLTATHATATGSSGARSANTKIAGKYYWEVTVGQTSGATDSIGIIAANADYSSLSTGYNMAVIRLSSGGGAIWQSGGPVSGKNLGGNVVAGDVLGIAFDATMRYIWFRKNGGPWNGDPTADPVSQAGAVGLSFSNPNPFVGFDGAGTAVGDNFTGNFGQLPFANPAPSGYGLWRTDPTTQTLVTAALANDDVFLAPIYVAGQVVQQAVSAAVGSDDAINTPFISQVALYAPLVTDLDAHYASTQLGGNRLMLPSAVVDSDSIYNASTLPKTQVLSASRAGLGSVAVNRQNLTKATMVVNVGMVN